MRLSCSARCIPDYSFHQALTAISNAGFRYLETFTDDTGAALDPTIVHTVRIKETFAHYRLALSSLNLVPMAPAGEPGATEVDADRRAEIVMARELWLDTVNVTTGQPESGPRETVVERLRRLADYAAGLGVSLAVANAPGTHVATPDDAERLLDDVDRPNVGLVLDLVRFHLAGQDVMKAVSRLTPRALLVRTGDVAEGRWVALGSGEIDNERALGALGGAGFDGFVVLEMRLTARGEVEGVMKRAFERLEPLVRDPAVESILSPNASGEDPVSPPAH